MVGAARKVVGMKHRVYGEIGHEPIHYAAQGPMTL